MRHIAEERRRSNILEYLLYLWQMEDLLRSVAFDLDRLSESVLSSIDDEELRRENLMWFTQLSRSLKSNKAETSGHSAETYEVLGELNLLQHTLLTVLNDEAFKKLYFEAQPILGEFRQKSDKVPKSDTEVALTAMYGYLTLRLSGSEISTETQEAIEVFGAYLRYLAKAYQQMKKGTLPLHN